MNSNTTPLNKLDKAHFLHPFTDFKEYKETDTAIYTKAEHIYIYNEEGKQLLDGMSGLWCCNLGYSQPKINEAITNQLNTLPFYNAFFQCAADVSVQMAKALVDISPAQFNHVFFTNSGSEANDTNIRLVHRYYDLLGKPSKKIFISRHGAYHGSTVAAGSLGGFGGMHKQYTGLSYVEHINQPNWFTEGGNMDKAEFGIKVAQELAAKIDEVGEENVAAFIAEPIQGAGGVIVPPESYWPEISRICKERDILLISDEVICGFGRTGDWFGAQTFGYEPDLMTFAKAVTNGYQPLGGVMVSDKVADVLASDGGEFTHGFTYSGHPAACAAGIATIDILKNDKVIENAAADIMPYFQAQLRTLESHPIVGEVRGMGMVAALEIAKNNSAKERLAPDCAGGAMVKTHAINHGLMVRSVGDAIVTAPPMVCTREEIDLLITRLTIALDYTAKHYGIKT